MDGVAVGSLYALIALGYTMVYGILKFINFAHSDVFVLGAWVAFSAAVVGGWVDVDPLAEGLQRGAVGPWVLALLGAISVAAGLLAAYELGVRPRVAGPGPSRWPATRLWGTFA